MTLTEEFCAIFRSVHDFYDKLHKQRWLSTEQREQVLDLKGLLGLVEATSLQELLETIANSLRPTPILVDFRDEDHLEEELRQLLNRKESELPATTSLPEPKATEKLGDFVSVIRKRSRKGKYAKSPAAAVAMIPERCPEVLPRTLMRYQLNIAWNTSTGFPNAMDIYKGDMPPSYDIRRAALMGQVYEERHEIPEVLSVKKQEYVCPPIYTRLKNTKPFGKDWQVSYFTKGQFRTVETDFPVWITHEKLKGFLACDHCVTKYNYRTHTGATNALFLLLIRDDTYRRAGNASSPNGARAPKEHMFVNLPSEFQVYVGTAERGTLDRWVYGRNSHCNSIWAFYKHVNQLREWKPFPGKISLPELSLALARMRGQDCALFVISNHSNTKDLMDESARLINHYELGPFTDMRFGMNEKLKQAVVPTNSREVSSVLTKTW
ncbi:uncharacterized protein LOC144884836 [Branchiostoma floridae x Branchiostoma japonicum]